MPSNIKKAFKCLPCLLSYRCMCIYLVYYFDMSVLQNLFTGVSLPFYYFTICISGSEKKNTEICGRGFWLVLL